MIRRLAPLSLALLAACSTTALPPVTERPVPAGWTMAQAGEGVRAPERWWEAFGDPVLNDLAERAGATEEVVVAEARLDAALARFGIATAQLKPMVSGLASVEPRTAGSFDQTIGRAALDARWDLDVSGSLKLRRASAAASAEAARARIDAVRISSRAAAVRFYIAYREADAQALAADRSLASLADLSGLVGSRERAGLVPGLDAAAARAEEARARVRPLAAREARDRARLSLEALLGLDPGALAETLARDGPVPGARAPAILATPLAVVATRPDLVAAERDLVAAGFDAEAARRDFWPSLSLGAAIGAQAATPETFFTMSGLLASLLGQLTVPILTGGRLEAERQLADATRVEAAARYRQAATDALAEVETALVAFGSANQRTTALTATVTAARDQARLARARYLGGLATFSDVLIAERSVFDAEADLAIATADSGRAFTALNAALGAGAAPYRPPVAAAALSAPERRTSG